eukprot:Skav215257  [mRNA]  locus=scaffold811:341510:355193:- [translate_table: standard]
MPAKSKEESVGKISRYWAQLHARVQWTDEQEHCAVSELSESEFLSARIDKKQLKDDRPDWTEFQKVLRASKGTASLDRWSASEAKVIASCDEAVQDIWKAMEIWEATSLTPSHMKQAKIVFLPKASTSDNAIAVKKLRPICVYPLWYRCWSTAWIKSEILRPLRELAPKGCFGHSQVRGPEPLAATIDALVDSWGFACSLDYTHAFDVVNLNVIQGALRHVLEGETLQWANAITSHWKAAQKWLCYNKNVSATPYQSHLGIPQGESASPSILMLILNLGMNHAQQNIPVSYARQFIYVDDRSIVTRDLITLRLMITRWREFADAFHFLENEQKRQIMSKQFPELGTSISVLGSLIGDPSCSEYRQFSKHVKRLDDSVKTAFRLKCAPCNVNTKMNDVMLFVKSKAAYGWICGEPPHIFIKKYSAQSWKSMGKFNYALKELKTMFNLRTNLRASVFPSQIRILIYRNQILSDLGESLNIWTKLDKMVADGLVHYGWFQNGTTWTHEVLPYALDLTLQYDTKAWKSFMRGVRQSMTWKNYMRFQESARHEVANEEIPPFSEERLDLTRKWVAISGRHLTFAMGAKVSPWIYSDPPPTCPVCGRAFDWSHYWNCGLRCAEPDDVMFKRFLWPKNESDLALARQFMNVVDEFQCFHRLFNLRTNLQASVFLSQFRILIHRNQILSDLGESLDRWTKLDKLVADGLVSYGWFQNGTTWTHEVLPYSLDLTLQYDAKAWKSLMHSVRQSMRWTCYTQLHESARHEVVSEEIPPFSEERLELIRKWVALSGRHLTFAMGAKVSPWIYSDPPPKCPVCDRPFTWSHYWNCGLRIPEPDDVMFKRSLWPKDESDLALVHQFICAVDELQPVGEQRAVPPGPLTSVLAGLLSWKVRTLPAQIDADNMIYVIDFEQTPFGASWGFATSMFDVHFPIFDIWDDSAVVLGDGCLRDSVADLPTGPEQALGDNALYGEPACDLGSGPVQALGDQQLRDDWRGLLGFSPVLAFYAAMMNILVCVRSMTMVGSSGFDRSFHELCLSLSDLWDGSAVALGDGRLRDPVTDLLAGPEQALGEDALYGDHACNLGPGPVQALGDQQLADGCCLLVSGPVQALHAAIMNILVCVRVMTMVVLSAMIRNLYGLCLSLSCYGPGLALGELQGRAHSSVNDAPMHCREDKVLEDDCEDEACFENHVMGDEAIFASNDIRHLLRAGVYRRKEKNRMMRLKAERKKRLGKVNEPAKSEGTSSEEMECNVSDAEWHSSSSDDFDDLEALLELSWEIEPIEEELDSSAQTSEEVGDSKDEPTFSWGNSPQQWMKFADFKAEDAQEDRIEMGKAFRPRPEHDDIVFEEPQEQDDVDQVHSEEILQDAEDIVGSFLAVVDGAPKSQDSGAQETFDSELEDGLANQKQSTSIDPIHKAVDDGRLLLTSFQRPEAGTKVYVLQGNPFRSPKKDDAGACDGAEAGNNRKAPQDEEICGTSACGGAEAGNPQDQHRSKEQQASIHEEFTKWLGEVGQGICDEVLEIFRHVATHAASSEAKIHEVEYMKGMVESLGAQVRHMLNEDIKAQMRAGALGSKVTARKRELRELYDRVKEWVSEVEDEEERALGDLLVELMQKLQEYDNKARKVASSVISEALKKLEKIEKTNAPSVTAMGQSFYNAGGKAKGKGKGKTKNKILKEEAIPRFDLSREFPRSNIVTWQSVAKTLEEGEKPKGEVCVCKSTQQMVEFQQMAAALEVQKKMVLPCASVDSDIEVPGATTKMLPIAGNLALIKAKVACLSKEATDALNGIEPKEMKAKATQDEQGVVIRVTIVIKYLPNRNLLGNLRMNPHHALKLLGCNFDTKTYRWETAGGDAITGYAVIPDDKLGEVLGLSGNNGIFTSRLSKDVIFRPKVTWIPRGDNTSDSAYFDTAQQAANAAKVAMAWRRGGNDDLGILVEDKDRESTFWAGHQQWSPWKINAKAPSESLQFAYKVEDRHLVLVPWKQTRTQQAETERLCGRKWYGHEAVDIEKISDAEMIAATVLDPIEPTAPEAAEDDELMTQDQKDALEKRKAETKEIKDKGKKARTGPKLVKVEGGERGPDDTTVIECGGDGDCAWRALGFLLGCLNLIENKGYKAGRVLAEKVAPRAQALGKSLKAQANTFLRYTEKSWQKNWCPDPIWNTTTEAGEPAKTLEEFFDVIERPGRYADHFSLQAVATLKKVTIVIWQKEEEIGWRKMAVMRPSEAGRTPILPIVLTGRHYMPLIREGNTNFPLDWITHEAEEGVWYSVGVQNEVIEASQERINSAIFRGAGGSAPRTSSKTPMTERDLSDVEMMLRTPRSYKSSKSLSTDGMLMTPKSAKSLMTNQLLATPKTVKSKKEEMEGDSTKKKKGIKVLKKHLKKNKERKSGAASWKCSECGLTIPIQSVNGRVNYGDITAHLRRFHAHVYLEKRQKFAKAGYKCGSGMTIAERPEVDDFQWVKKKPGESYELSCAFCDMRVKKMPQTNKSKYRLMRSHYNECKQKPENFKFRQWACRSRKFEDDGVRSAQAQIALDHRITWLKAKRKAAAAKLGHDVVTIEAKKSLRKDKLLKKCPVGHAVITFCKKNKLSRPTHGSRFNRPCAGKPVNTRRGIPPGDDWWRNHCRHNDPEAFLNAIEATEEEKTAVRSLIGKPTRRGLTKQLKEKSFADRYRLSSFIARRDKAAREKGHVPVTFQAKRSPKSAEKIKRMPLAWSHITFCKVCRLSWPTHSPLWNKGCKGKPVRTFKGLAPSDEWWHNICTLNGTEYVLEAIQASDAEKEEIRAVVEKKKCKKAHLKSKAKKTKARKASKAKKSVGGATEGQVMHENASVMEVELASCQLRVGLSEKEQKEFKRRITAADLRGGMTQEASACDGAEAGKVKQKKEKKKIGKVWTCNVAGIPGLWRMIHYLRGVSFDARPEVIFLQEIQCNMTDWSVSQSSLDALGYLVHACNKTGMNGKGVVTLIKQTIHCAFHSCLNTSNGAALAVEVSGRLLINIYIHPRHQAFIDWAEEFLDWYRDGGWKGQTLMAGDWNQEPGELWMRALVETMGFEVFAPEEATRWEGRRIIDFYISSLESPPQPPLLLDLRFSDHKVVQTAIDIKRSGKKDLCFPKQKSFPCPKWLQENQWKQCFKDAYQHGELTHWREVCFLLHSKGFDLECEDEQANVDFLWNLTMLKNLWAFKLANYFALLLLPADWDDFTELNRVTHLANHLHWQRIKIPKPATRCFPTSGQEHSQAFRKLSNRLSRGLELLRHLQFERATFPTRRLIDKLFGKEAPWPTKEDVEGLVLHVQSQLQNMEKEDKKTAYSRWRSRMKTLSHRANWLNKKLATRYPSVCSNDEQRNLPAKSKEESVDKINQYWTQLHARVQWTEDQEEQAATELSQYISAKLDSCQIQDDRPHWTEFQKTLKSSKGTAGLDQWSTQEAKVIANCDQAVQDIWKAMEMWEATTLTPSHMRHAKIVFLPKTNSNDNVIPVKKLRPICVYPVWYRTWSTTWIKSEVLRPLRELAPKGCFGHSQVRGPEPLAATIDALVDSWGFACSLDYTHAFDVVNVNVLQGALQQVLNGDSLEWATTITSHWKSTQKWLSYNKNVSATPYQSDLGIPQGDSASPLMLMLLLNLGMNRAQQCIPVSYARQFIYMDDRSSVTKDLVTLRLMITRWREFADAFHLIENEDKLQIMSKQFPELGTSISVLGSSIGDPTCSEYKQFSKHVKRLDESLKTAFRLKCTPCNVNTKMNDVMLFVKSKAAYGWICGEPPHEFVKKFSTQTWRSMGKFNYGVKELKTLFNLHTDLRASVFLSQLRILIHRNQILNDLGESMDRWTKLDKLVADGLVFYGWFQNGTTWTHETLPYILDLTLQYDSKAWKSLMHGIRQSMRWKYYMFLHESARHEVVNEEIPPFTEERLHLIRKWADLSGRHLTFAMGAKVSPWIYSDPPPKCPVCDRPFNWSHYYWNCGLRIPEPDDVMLKRFLWPKDESDLALVHQFICAVDELTRQNIPEWLLKGVSEETTTGVHRLREMAAKGELLFPAINVNDCVTKSKFDNVYGFREASAQEMCTAFFAVVTIEESVADVDIFTSATGNFKIITLEHMKKMKNNAIVCNIG